MGQLAELVRRAEHDRGAVPHGHAGASARPSVDGPAREAAADDVLRAAGILPGDPSLYPRTLDDVFPFGTGPERAPVPAELVATIGAHGITARLPDGFEGRIFVRPPAVGATYPVASSPPSPSPTTSATSAAAPST